MDTFSKIKDGFFKTSNIKNELMFCDTLLHIKNKCFVIIHVFYSPTPANEIDKPCGT
jgi:hypothetical protein